MRWVFVGKAHLLRICSSISPLWCFALLIYWFVLDTLYSNSCSWLWVVVQLILSLSILFKKMQYLYLFFESFTHVHNSSKTLPCPPPSQAWSLDPPASASHAEFTGVCHGAWILVFLLKTCTSLGIVGCLESLFSRWLLPLFFWIHTKVSTALVCSFIWMFIVIVGSWLSLMVAVCLSPRDRVLC